MLTQSSDSYTKYRAIVMSCVTVGLSQCSMSVDIDLELDTARNYVSRAFSIINRVCLSDVFGKSKY